MKRGYVSLLILLTFSIFLASSEAKARAQLLPPSLTASPVSSSQIHLTWNDPNKTESGYSIERSLSSQGVFTEVNRVGKNKTTYNDTGLASGITYYYKVKAFNRKETAYSNTASATTQQNDTIPPSVSITSPPSGTFYATAQTVTITASASDNVGVTRVEFYDASTLKGTDTTNAYTYNWTFTGADNGTHNWIAKAYDAAGNVTSSSIVSLTVNIDITPPSVPTGLTAATATCNQINLSWNASADTGGSGLKGYKVYRNGSFLKQVTTNSTSDTGLSASTTYSYTVSSIDNANNESAQSVSASDTTPQCPDTNPPSVSITNPPSGTTYTTAQTVTITASASDNVGVTKVEFYDGSVLKGTDTSAPYSYAWAFTGSDNRTHNWTAKAYDADNSSVSNVISLIINIDIAPPTVPVGLTATAVDCSQINLGWSASTDTGGSGLKGYKVYRNGSFLKQVTTISTTDTGLSASTTYSYTVSSVDNANNESAQSASASDITPQCPDTNPPSVSITSPTSGTTYTTAQTVTITASASDNVGVTRVEFYDASTLKGTDTTNAYTYNWTFMASDNGTHNWIAKAYDAAGNVTNSSTVSLTVNIDITPPSVPTGLTANAISCDQINLSWNASTDTGGSGLKGYKVYRNGSFLKQVTTISTTDTGLSASTTYSYTVSSVDNANNESAQCNSVNETTPACTDAMPPSIPTGLTATAVSSSQIDLRWSPSFDTGGSGLAGYKVYRSTTQIGTTTATNYSDYGRAANTQYCYKVAAYDNAGNTSAQSTQACATTQADQVAGWNLVPTDGVMNSFTTLYSVWTSDPSNVWAVGYSSGWGTIFKWNGTSWSVAWSGSSTIPRAIWGSSASDVWAVGSHGVILHWNGTSWSLVSNPAGDNNINAVWGTGPGNVWAVGPVDTATNYSFALHWDGRSWSVVPTGSTLRLTGIWGSGTNDIWAVGLNGGILHWNGTSWSTSVYGMVSLPNLWSIWGSAPNDVWAVGGSPTLGNKLMHWNGSSWSTITPVTTSSLYGVWGTAGNDVWVVGAAGTILNWNGTAWSQAESPTTYDLNSVHGTVSDAWTVGTGGTVLQNQEP